MLKKKSIEIQKNNKKIKIFSVIFLIVLILIGFRFIEQDTILFVVYTISSIVVLLPIIIFGSIFLVRFIKDVIEQKKIKDNSKFGK